MIETPSRRPGFKDRGVVWGFVLGVAIALLIGAIAWLRLAPGDVSTPSFTPDPNLSTQERRGFGIYVANCASCHGGPTGGGMMDYPPRHNANGHTWHHPDCELRQIVRDGGDEMTEMMRQMMAPSNSPTMQAFRDRLSDEEIEAVLAFIKTMWAPEERDAQATVTKQACVPV